VAGLSHGHHAREQQTKPLRTRVQEVASGDAAQRVFVIDSTNAAPMRKANASSRWKRTRAKLASVQAQVTRGKLKKPEDIGAAAERALRAHHGYRYFTLGDPWQAPLCFSRTPSVWNPRNAWKASM